MQVRERERRRKEKIIVGNHNKIPFEIKTECRAEESVFVKHREGSPESHNKSRQLYQTIVNLDN